MNDKFNHIIYPPPNLSELSPDLLSEYHSELGLGPRRIKMYFVLKLRKEYLRSINSESLYHDNIYPLNKNKQHKLNFAEDVKNGEC